MVGPGYLNSSQTERAYQRNAPKGSQVVVDAGPARLGCTSRKKLPACTPVVLAQVSAGRFRFLYGFGTEDFLDPGSEMGLFVAEHRLRACDNPEDCEVR